MYFCGIYPMKSLSHSIIATTIVTAVLTVAGCSSYQEPVLSGQCYIDVTATTDNRFLMSDGTLVDPMGETEQDPTDADVKFILTDLTTGATHTWNNIKDFSPTDGYTSGTYRLQASVPSGYGYYLQCDTTLTLLPAMINRVNLTLRPDVAQVVMEANKENAHTWNVEGVMLKGIATKGFTSLTEGGNFIQPGRTDFIATVTDTDGCLANVCIGNPIEISSGRCYMAKLEAEESSLTLSLDGKSHAVLNISDALFNSPSPAIVTQGFVSGELINIKEGVSIQQNILMKAEASAPLKHVYLGVDSPEMVQARLLPESQLVYDLLNLEPSQNQEIAASELIVERSYDDLSVTVDFTKVLSKIASITTSETNFTLWVIDSLGRTSSTCELQILTQSAAFEIESVTEAVLGENLAHITLQANMDGCEAEDFVFTTNGTECPIYNFTNLNGNSISMDILVPQGISSLNVDMLYMGLKRASFTVARSVPTYTILEDAYANSVNLHILTQNERSAAAITSYIQVYKDNRQVTIAARDTANAIVTLTGLAPDTHYEFSARIPDIDGSHTAVFTTEKMLKLPDGDFEDAAPSMLKYKDLPSGGRYAISPIDIANRQNMVTIDEPWVKTGWASVNARTFCTDASRHNTWYMQLSTLLVSDASSGHNAMMLRSVGWDTDGEEIPDYIPATFADSKPFNPYAPAVAHRSAGRLFLGRYSYNASTDSELFEEGIPFESRPSSLNGFFKFLPDATDGADRGSVSVTLVNRRDGFDTVVAKGYMEFSLSADFKAFNLPLVYKLNTVRPTHLKIMFMSSSRGDEKPLEDNNVPLTPYPEKGAYTGSCLWIDNLSLTY